LVSLFSVGTLLGVLSFWGDTTTKTTQKLAEANMAVPATQPSLVVPDGKRAVSVRVTCERAGIGPLGMLGHRVDVLSIMPDPVDARRTLSNLVVEDVLLMAVNRDTVTLAVSPEQAEKLDDAKKRGSITLEPHRAEE
jgi:Flp pilus assembly protein CpaB